MKFNVEEYLEEEKEKEIEQAERDTYNSEWWYYNPHEDAGDRI